MIQAAQFANATILRTLPNLSVVSREGQVSVASKSSIGTLLRVNKYLYLYELSPKLHRHIHALSRCPAPLAHDILCMPPQGGMEFEGWTILIHKSQLSGVDKSHMLLNLRVEAIESMAAFCALGPEWQSLFAASGQELPFFTFEWADCWWAHMREERKSVRDSLHFRTLRTEDGKLVAVAPLVSTERPAVGPLRMRYLQFLGADPNMTEVRGMLTLPGYEQEAYRTLICDLARTPWDWIHWSGLRTTENSEELECPWSIEKEEVRDQILCLAPTWEEYRSTLPRNIQESLRKCYNSLKRNNHVAVLRIAKDHAEIHTALDRFFLYHKARSQVSDTIPHANVFESQASQSFLRDVCCRLADSGITRIFELEVNGQVVATRIGFQFPNSLYLYYSGYLPEWAPFSVMTTTVAEAIKYAINEGLSTVNLSPGLDVSKTRWRPNEVVYRQGVQVAPTRRAVLAYRSYHKALQLRKHRMLRVFARGLSSTSEPSKN